MLSRLSVYTETRDDNSEKEGKPAGDAENGSARQANADNLGLLHAQQKIHYSLWMHMEGVKDLINVFEGIDVTDISAVLPLLGALTVAAFCPSGRAAEGMKDSKDVYSDMSEKQSNTKWAWVTSTHNVPTYKYGKKPL